MKRSPYHLTAPTRLREPLSGSSSVRFTEYEVPRPQQEERNPIWVPTHVPQCGSARAIAQEHQHLHPLRQIHTRKETIQTHRRIHLSHSQLSQPQGLTPSILGSLRDQLYRLLSTIHQHDALLDDVPSKKSYHWISIAVSVLVLAIVTWYGLVPYSHKANEWSRLERRQLQGRQCVMNLFIDKQPQDEFNPDYIDPKKLSSTSSVVDGTYRTKGHMKIIGRFISSVADSFRSNVSLQQHVVFVGARDGGHLAELASKHWPPRGVHRTHLHVLAAPPSDEDALEYDTLQSLENRFDQDKEHVHLFDAHGNRAGNHREEEESEDSSEDSSKQRRRLSEHDDVDLESLIFPDGDLDDDVVVPYMHVDGTSMEEQMKTLEQASSLLDATKIVVIGLEHSPDMDVEELIEFFRSKQYKTFMLGLRQLTRIDNLCPELLENIMQHPSLDTNSKHPSWWSFQQSQTVSSENQYPPFFVAMPKGRQSKEEMTIQHMYDLFSGSGGGGQVKTANDRKAPGK